MTKLLVGLGNPGREYEGTRHNVGYMFLDDLKTKISNVKYQINNSNVKDKTKIISINTEIVINGIKVVLMKPQTFMNRSGVAVSSFMNMYKLDLSQDLIVVHDDLDIRLGEYKIQKGKGPMLHNGIESIEQAMGTKDFTRVRIGIDNRDIENRISGEAYVLQKFSSEEIAKLPFDEIRVHVLKLIYLS